MKEKTTKPSFIICLFVLINSIILCSEVYSLSRSLDFSAPDSAKRYIITSSNYTPVAGDEIVLKAQLVDLNNTPIRKFGNSVTWTKSDPNGSFSSSITITDTNGIATALLKTHTVVGLSIKIMCNTDSLTGTSQTITTVPGMEKKYFVTANSYNPAVKSSVLLNAQLVDEYNNPVNTAGKNVLWSKSDNYGQLSTLNSLTDSTGRSAVNLTTHTVSGISTTITASTDSLTGTSQTITTIPGPAEKYMVTSSSNFPTSGGQVTITAQLVDAYNNLVQTAGFIATWSKSDPNGSFSTPISTTDLYGTATVTLTTNVASGSSTTVTCTTDTITGTSAIISTLPGNEINNVESQEPPTFTWGLSPSFGATYTNISQSSNENENLELLFGLLGNFGYAGERFQFDADIFIQYGQRVAPHAEPQKTQDNLVFNLMPSFRLINSPTIRLFWQTKAETQLKKGILNEQETEFFDPAYLTHSLFLGNKNHLITQTEDQMFTVVYGIGYSFQQIIKKDFQLESEILQNSNAEYIDGPTVVFNLRFSKRFNDYINAEVSMGSLLLAKKEFFSSKTNSRFSSLLAASLNIDRFSIQYTNRLVYDKEISNRRLLDQSIVIGIKFTI